MTMRLTFRQSIGSFLFKRFEHERHGIVETLTKDTVTYVRPVFGLLKKDEQQQPEVADFRARKPKRSRKRRTAVVDMLKRLTAGGGEA